MATNPMKRREQNAFLIGIVIGLILVLVVGLLLFTMYNKTKTEFENYKHSLEEREMIVVVANDTIKSDDFIKKEMFTTAKIIVDSENIDAYKDACYTNIDEMFVVDAPDGEKQEVDEESGVLYARFEIPKGAIITKNLIGDSENPINDDTRLKEYNTIVLPSELKQNDVIDVRLALPTGQDFIVLSKKHVLNCDETTVWMNVDEAEIQTMNSAMVEAWTITGAKLYAVQYADAGMQTSAVLTYQPRAEVTTLIVNNPNIVKEARDALGAQWDKAQAADFRSEYIDPVLKENIEDSATSVEAGFAEESATIRTHRSDFIDSLGEE